MIEAKNENEARNIVFNSFIKDKFCTSYEYDKHIDEFKNKYKMFEINLQDLINFVEAEKDRIKATDNTTKAYYQLIKNKNKETK